jgi:hypothetical protein
MITQTGPNGKTGGLTVESVRKRLDALKEEERFLVRPDKLQKWDLTILLALLFTAVVTPFEVAFLETEINVLFIVNRLIDLIFIFDMVKEFHLMYYHENGFLIKSHRMIRRRYLRSWFAIDLVTIIPYDLAKYIVEGKKLKTVSSRCHTLDLPILLFFPVPQVRIVRLFRLLKLARIFKATRIFTRWQTRLGMQHGTLTAIELTIGLTAAIHWFACCWGLLPFLLAEHETTWLSHWLDNKPDLGEHCYSTAAGECMRLIVFMYLQQRRRNRSSRQRRGASRLREQWRAVHRMPSAGGHDNHGCR